jgi:hypothetical protein
MNNFEVILKKNNDTIQFSAGEERVTVEIIENSKNRLDPGMMIDFEADEIDLVMSALKLFQERVRSGRYPENDE